MGQQPTYEELKHKVAELEVAGAKWKRTEQELEEKNQELQNHSRLLDIMTGQMVDMVYYKDNEFRYIFSSKAHCDRILKCTQEECIGLTDVEIAERYRQSGHEQGFGEICINSDQETEKAGKPSQFDEVATINGEEIWLEVYKTPLYDEAGKFAGIIGCSREATKRKRVEAELKQYRDNLEETVKVRTAELEREIGERKRAEGELRASEEQLRGILASFHGSAIVLYDREGVHTAVWGPPDLEERYGAKSEEFVGLSMTDLYPPDQANKRIARIQNVFETGETLRDKVLSSYATGEFRQDVTLTPLYGQSGEVLKVVAFIRDITEQVKAEEALRESEERYRTLFDHSPAVLAEYDHSSIRTYVDDARRAGVTDIKTYFRNHPERLEKCIAGIRLLDVNQAALDLYKADSVDTLRESKPKMARQTYELMEEYIISVVEGKKIFACDDVHQTVHGEQLHLNFTMVAAPGYEESLSRVFVSALNITERKRAEQALMQSEGLYRSTIDAMGDGIHVVDRALRITLVNETFTQWCRKYGAEADILGKTVFEAFPFLPDKVRDEYKQVVATGEALVTEEGTIFGDRKIVTETRKIPIIESDTVVRIVTVVRNITAKKQIEEALRDSEERYRALVNQSADGIFLIDLETKRITGLNPALPRLLGYTLEEILSMTMYEFIAHDRISIDKNFQEIINKGYFRAERQYRRKDGTLVDVEVSSNLISYGGKKVISSVVRDITERKQAGRMLQKERDNAQNYFDIAGVMILVIGVDKKVKRINRKGCEILGYEENEMTGKPWLENFVPEKDKPGLQKVFAQVISGKSEEVEYYENAVLKKNGEERLIAWHNSVIRDESGTIVEYLGSGTDITERKRAEAALRKSEERYRQLFEQSRDAICVTTRDARFLDVNQAALDLFGYTREEMLALDVAKDLYANPGEREKYQQELEEKGFVRDYGVKLRKKDGTPLDILLTTTLLRDNGGKIIGYLGITRDITEHKEVEAALQEAFEKREELEKIINRSPGIAFLWRATEGWPVEFVSENVREFGYRPEDFYSGKVDFADIIYSEDLERVGAEVSNYMNEEGRKNFTQEYRIVTPFGDVRWIDDRTWIRRSEEGEVTHFQGIVFDITERKQAEEALQESEQRLELALRGADLGLWDWTIETGEVIHNKRWAEMRGYGLDEIEPSIKSFEKTIHPDDHPKVMKALQLHTERHTPYYESEHRFKTKAGEWRWVLDRGRVVERDANGKPVRAAGTNLDITEQKKAEESLRVSEERVRTLVEQSPFGIQIFNTDGLLIQANRAWEEIWEANAEEAVGKHNALKDAQIKKMDIYPLIRRVFTGETADFPVTEFDPGTSGLPGHKRWVRTRAYQIRDKDGVIQNIVLFSEDVTDRKRDEEEKKRLEGQLLQAQKMKAIGTLAGGIAHDFNNLLMGIQGRVSLMSLDTDDKHPHAEHHKGIEDMVRRGADLTGQLLGFARGGKYEVKPTDLNDLILKSSQMFGRTKKQVKISCLYQKDLWTVEIDQGQIEQVMLSLYVNAAQAMPGGGALSVQTENVILQESSAEVFQIKPGKYVKASVTDTGTGMDEETRERIFDPFFTTKEMGRGTGLSLASAYGVIKSHGGAIDVYSTEGEGTNITIYLPASDKPVVKEKKAVAEETKGGETVLLVDDEDMIIEIGEKILSSMGYKVLLAKSGREAIKIYEENKEGIDIVLLDLVMPDMGGGETYDRLKEIDPGIKVLLASGYSIDGQASEVLARGCDGFIQKPFNMKQLSEKIREILGKEA